MAVRDACRTHGGVANIYPCDVSDFEACKALSAKIIEDFGTIDILVNNAGITRDGLILRMKEEEWDAVVDTNLKGVFNMIRHVSPVFIKARRGRIINISSVSGIFGNAGQANYSAAKAGVIGITKSVARELAGRGITCNAIAPGFLETDMTAALAGQGDKITQTIPLGSFGTVEDVAQAAAFLAGSGAAYITGEVLRVDGGIAI